jgi:CelD/BcsL family acetyltransferase involved in cellulose biosynthesis
VRLLRLGAPEVADLWQDLQQRGFVRTPFETWEWASALRDVPECSGGVRVALVDMGGRPVGLFALEGAIDDNGLRLVGPAGWRWLVPDHVDVLAAPGHRDLVAGAVLRYLFCHRGWDVLDLDGLRPDGGLATALAGRRDLLTPHRRPERVPVPFVDLRNFNLTKPFRSPKLRRAIVRGLRVAERDGGLTMTEQPEEVVSLLDELAGLHMARFGTASTLFATAARREFHRLAARRLAAAGKARIYRLRADGRPAAVVYVLVVGRVHYFYTIGIDPTAGLSPGRTTVGQAILTAAREGAQEFDLLRGDHGYKLRFATGIRQDVRLRPLRPTPRVLALAGSRLSMRVLRSAEERWLHPVR